MPKVQLLILCTGLFALCGCDKQVQVKTEKIDVLTQKMFILQQAQSKQLENLQTQLAVLSARLDKTEADYFVRSQEKALFYHTNTLYFLLAIDKRFQSQLDLATAARTAANSQAYIYHTNVTDTVLFCAAQIADGMAAMEKRVQDNARTNAVQLGGMVIEELDKQSNSAAADRADIVRQIKSLETKLAQVQRNLDLLQSQLNSPSALTNRP